MKHDYAMAEINLLEGELNPDDIKTIRHALRMMQKLEEPSHDMFNAGYNSFFDPIGQSNSPLNKIRIGNSFRAIIKQAKKEISNEKV
jgi:hypothetical protein